MMLFNLAPLVKRNLPVYLENGIQDYKAHKYILKYITF